MNNKARYRATAKKAIRNPNLLSEKELAFLNRSVQTNPKILAIVKAEIRIRAGN